MSGGVIGALGGIVGNVVGHVVHEALSSHDDAPATAPAAAPADNAAGAANCDANPHRGEASLILGEIVHTLRPTFSALVAAEEELGPLFGLVERATAGQFKLSELVALFWHCLKDRDELTREEFAERLTEAGLAVCARPLRALLVQVLKGIG